jgi:hypothetical protein
MPVEKRLESRSDFYVYCYYDGNIPIYIGKGHGTRFLWHLGRKDVHPLTERIAQIRSRHLEPGVTKLQENLTEAEAYTLEKMMIKQIGRADLGLGPLLNRNNGGGGFGCGPRGWHETEAQKEKRVTRLCEVLRSPEHRAKISRIMVEKHKQPVYKQMQKEKQKEVFATKPRMSCEHCGKSELTHMLYFRWHGNNCKLRNQYGTL